jgi:hypothetical protein
LLRRPTRPPGFHLFDPGDRIARELDARWRDELQQYRSFPRPHQALTCLNGYAMFAASGEHWYAARHAMTTADPFTDPDLSRWMLSLPADLQCRRGQPKALWRRLLRGRIPQPLLERPKSSDLTPFLIASINRHAMPLDRHYQRGLAVGSEILGREFDDDPQSSGSIAPARAALTRYLYSYLGLWLESANSGRQ